MELPHHDTLDKHMTNNCAISNEINQILIGSHRYRACSRESRISKSKVHYTNMSAKILFAKSEMV